MSHVYEDTMMKCITSFSSPKKLIRVREEENGVGGNLKGSK